MIGDRKGFGDWRERYAAMIRCNVWLVFQGSVTGVISDKLMVAEWVSPCKLITSV